VQHVGRPTGDASGDPDLAVFVDRLAAAGSDRPTTIAARRIRQVVVAGHAPPGVRRLAEALAATVSELPPTPRQPSEGPASVVAAMRVHGFLVLEDVDPAAVAATVSALVDDGRRVVVTGSTVAELADVRHSLPDVTRARVVDELPALAPGEMRELRTLLATSTPQRRARAGQTLPDPAHLPSPDEVARLCVGAERHQRSGPAVGMISALLAGLEQDRRDAVTAVAARVSHALGGMPRRDESEWAWTLLSDLIYGQHRAVFDRMTEDTAQSVAALERTRTAPSVQVAAPLPPGSLDAVRRYGEFLRSGGRSRSYFRGPVQRDVVPVLRVLRVGGRIPETYDDIQRVLDHLELAERLSRIDASCAEIGLAAPRNEAELNELADVIVRVGAAARSVGALRHDVLFLGTDSPLAVPDVETAQQVAAAILQYAAHGPVAEAGRDLDRMADDLARRGASPEVEHAIAALRARDVTGYVTALEAIGRARREKQDEARRSELAARLAEQSRGLAAAWTASDSPSAPGFAWFTPVDGLLSAVPGADAVDVVVVLGAARMGVERLLLTAAAPRMIAVMAPGERADAAPTLLSVLQRASALVIRGRSAAPATVVPITTARKVTTPIGQAGA
jgi:hypothetical protein